MTIQNVVESGIPRQVMFYDGDDMCAGIMLGDKIVCACCGAIFEVDDVIAFAREDGVEAIKMFTNWVDISYEIKGDVSDQLESTVTLEMEDC